MTDFTLTNGDDTFTGTAADDTVNATASTLYSRDSLTGGAGTDTLALYGSGNFGVDQLATFTGFEFIDLRNGQGTVSLFLGSQSLAVIGNFQGQGQRVYLGSGAVTCVGIDVVYSTSASNWSAGNWIEAPSIYLNTDGSENALYDLTTSTLSHINFLNGTNLTVQIDSAVASGVAHFYGGTNAKLVTSDAALDLSHSTVNDFTVESSNATGTNFTVSDLYTAFQVAGGSGTDTLTAQGFVFSAGQRYAIFANASVERIVDASGTYTVDNAWPNIISNGGGNTAAVSIAENTTAVTTVTTTDTDVGQTLSYSISGGADESKFTVDPTTGALSFIAAPDFEVPTDAGGNNVYDVIVQVSDGLGGVDTQAIAVTVNDVFENTAPVITSTGGGDAAAISIAENSTAVTTVTATDPDVGQPLSYSISGGADESKFTVDATTGALSFRTAPDFELPSDAGGNNVYDVTVQVSDGHGGVDTQAVAVTVQNVGSTVNGTSQAQTLTGTGQEDFLYGMGGNDNLQGLAGNDYLDGGSGKDTMTGGAGNDTYVVDNSGDVVIENSGNDTDTVLSYISFTLGANFEWLTLSGSGKIDGTGNALDNNVTGNSGNNKLSGLAGDDLLDGGAGNDTLVGGLGADLLTGGAGADRFVYSAVADSTLTQHDVIQNFVHDADMIDIAAIDANAAKKSNQAFAFAGKNSDVVANSVTWYESGENTFVQADVNGDTTADLLIELTGTSLQLSASDFLL